MNTVEIQTYHGLSVAVGDLTIDRLPCHFYSGVKVAVACREDCGQDTLESIY